MDYILKSRSLIPKTINRQLLHTKLHSMKVPEQQLFPVLYLKVRSLKIKSLFRWLLMVVKLNFELGKEKDCLVPAI